MSKPATYTEIPGAKLAGSLLYVKGDDNKAERVRKALMQLHRDGEYARRLRAANQPYSEDFDA